MSTVINKRLFFQRISFCISLSFNLWVYLKLNVFFVMYENWRNSHLLIREMSEMMTEFKHIPEHVLLITVWGPQGLHSFPSVLWYCWLGLLTCKTFSQITYTVLAETLNTAQSISRSDGDCMYVVCCSCQSVGVAWLSASLWRVDAAA